MLYPPWGYVNEQYESPKAGPHMRNYFPYLYHLPTLFSESIDQIITSIDKALPKTYPP